MTLPIILDTDIGGDVDDLLALAVLLASPDVDLRAVTCVYGDVLTRARIALKALSLRNRTGVLVAAGAERAVNAERLLLCGKDDGEGFLATDDLALAPANRHAADVIVETVMSRPGALHLAAIGPLTNLALALLREPAVAQNAAGITIMGGVVGGPQRPDLPQVDYNFACDPEAARIVLASGARISLVPLDVTMQVHIYPLDVAAVRAVADPFHLALADQIERYPRYQEKGSTYLHDPLAVATLIQQDLVTWTPVHAEVAVGGKRSAGKLILQVPTRAVPANAKIALEVDATAAHDFIVSRLLA